MTALHSDTRLNFNEAKHEYSIQKGKKKVKLQSVTSFIKTFFQPFDEKAMARKLASFGWAKQQKKGVKYWLAQWKAAREDGTEVHKQIEEYILGERDLTFDNNPKAVSGFSYVDKISPYYAFIPEMRVFSEPLGLAGTIDLYCSDVTNRVTLVDWKTNKEIKAKGYEKNSNETVGHLEDSNLTHYTLQLSLYAYILETEYDETINELQLVHLKEDKYEVIKIPYERELVVSMLKEAGKLQ